MNPSSSGPDLPPAMTPKEAALNADWIRLMYESVRQMEAMFPPNKGRGKVATGYREGFPGVVARVRHSRDNWNWIEIQIEIVATPGITAGGKVHMVRPLDDAKNWYVGQWVEMTADVLFRGQTVASS